MIVSHEHKFIFVRTEKTAGSSVQRALSTICGPDDIVTGGVCGNSRNRKPAWAKRVPFRTGSLRRHFPEYFGFHTHSTIAQVRKHLGQRTSNSYFKFAIERNPWDRQLSLYCQRKKKGRSIDSASVNFRRDMQSWVYRGLHYTRLQNWGVYTINNQIAVDFVIPYENLQGGLSHVLQEIGIDQPMELLHQRSEWREKKGGYRESYTPELRDLIGRWYRREIDALGYEF